MSTVPQAFIDDLRRRGISDERTLAAMSLVPRHLFVPEESRQLAYEDRALPIDCEQTISQPFIVAWMTQLLGLRGDERVLEIGTGSGYQTAILARLAKEVVSIERLESLARGARSLLDQLGYRNVVFVTGDGTLGCEAYAPYDACLVAAASPGIPQPLIDQLGEGGRLVIPVGTEAEQDMLLITKDRQGRIRETSLGGCRFVKLVGQMGWPARRDD